jgi:hypothetical protein
MWSKRREEVQVGLRENSASIFYKIKAVQKTGFSGTFTKIKFDGLLKSPKMPSPVIPAKAGIQEIQELLDSRSPPARGQASRE